MKLFLDTEFLGLFQNTSLVSIALIAEDGRRFYGEVNDYNDDLLTEWLVENVINNLILNEDNHSDINRAMTKDGVTTYYGTTEYLKEELDMWLKQFDNIVIWSDCLAYDWVLFCELFGGAMNIPKNIFYIPFDLATLLEIKGIDPDISREDFAAPAKCENGDPLFFDIDGNLFTPCKHNALWDAWMIKRCYELAINYDKTLY